MPTTLRKQLLHHCFLEAGLKGSHLEEQVEQAFEHFIAARNDIAFYPETLEILNTLKQEFDLIALSNGNADINRVGLGDYFSAHFSAESTQKPKPDPAMFLAALEHANAEPHQAIHIGDHPEEDVNAAQRLGYRTIWFNQNAAKDQNLCKPDREIHQLNQLVTAIKSLLE